MSDAMKPMDALGIKVETLEGDVREVKDSILGLETKIEKGISDLAREVRASISALSNQFAERQRTPWGVLISGAGFLVAVLGIYGSQALAPIQADVKHVKETMVPRAEVEFRSLVQRERFERVERSIEQIQSRRYDELMKSHEQLQNELRDLRRGQGR